MDLATIIGLGLGTAMILWSMIGGGGGLAIFINIPSVAMVVGGSFAALMISNPLQRITKVGVYLKNVINVQNFEVEKIITTLVKFSEKARRDGLLAPELFNPILAALVLSMLATPFIIMASNRIVMRLVSSEWMMQSLQMTSIARQSINTRGHVLICGYGRSGQAMARVLTPEGVPYIALDLDPDRVRQELTEYGVIPEEWGGQNMFVNISAKQAAHSNFVGVVRRILSETGIAPHRLELELTETAIMEDPEFSLAELNRLKKLGVRLAIDDFGTGYSSLSHLSRFPMDTLKVDRSFVAGMGQTEGNQEIIKAVVGLAHILNLTVVAEGVETQRQFSMVRDMGCSVVQGYHLAHPMDAEQIETLLATQPHPSPA